MNPVHGKWTMNAPSPDHSLARKVAFLSNPRSWPAQPAWVETVETHMSWVFLTDREVYKLKKPIRLPFLDFRKLEDRERHCRTEVVLNARLAPGVYLGVEPVTRNRRGELQIGDGGMVVEWLVHMRRLPGDRMLDWLIRQRAVREEDVLPAARRLAEFYRQAPSPAYDPGAYLRRFYDLVAENHDALVDPAFGLPPEQCHRLRQDQLAFLDAHQELLQSRAKHVVEAHGDLRPEHICLVDPPVIYDCLEFNREFRLLDPVDELAFLMLECEMDGAGAIGKAFFETYRNTLHDEPPAALPAFYQCVRACLRAKLAVWHLEDDPRQSRRNWVKMAARYLDRAEHYAHRFRGISDQSGH